MLADEILELSPIMELFFVTPSLLTCRTNEMSFGVIRTICKSFVNVIALSASRGVQSAENLMCRTAQEPLMTETATLYVHVCYRRD